MEQEKSKLKELINHSPIFYIDKQSCLQVYKKELDLLAIRLFNLYGKIAQDYGEELYTALLDSVKYYDSSKGDFLVLFDINFKQKINKNKRNSQYQGIKVSEKIYAKAKFIYTKLKSNGKTLKDFSIEDIDYLYCKSLSDKTKHSIMDTLILLYNGKDSFVSISTNKDEDDSVSEEVLTNKQESAFESLEKNEKINVLLDKISEIYNNDVRSDTKKMFRIFITRSLLESEVSYSELQNKNFFDNWTYDFFVENKFLPKNIDIAKHEDKKEEKVSSLFKKFKEKLNTIKSLLK